MKEILHISLSKLFYTVINISIYNTQGFFEKFFVKILFPLNFIFLRLSEKHPGYHLILTLILKTIQINRGEKL